jgi:hypothetical protein
MTSQKPCINAQGVKIVNLLKITLLRVKIKRSLIPNVLFVVTLAMRKPNAVSRQRPVQKPRRRLSTNLSHKKTMSSM